MQNGVKGWGKWFHLDIPIDLANNYLSSFANTSTISNKEACPLSIGKDHLMSLTLNTSKSDKQYILSARKKRKVVQCNRGRNTQETQLLSKFFPASKQKTFQALFWFLEHGTYLNSSAAEHNPPAKFLQSKLFLLTEYFPHTLPSYNC